MTQNDGDAQDVLIGTFLEFCDQSEEHGAGDLGEQLMSIAVTKAVAKLRDFGDSENLVVRELAVWGDDYPQGFSKQKTSHVLENGLRSLSPMTRTVFVLRDMEQMPVDRIATIVGRSIPAIEVCLLRARLQLREFLAEHMKQLR